MANPAVLVDYLKKYFKGAKMVSAYEAGFCGYSLHRYLVAQGIENHVVHPAGIEIASNNSVKTDKRDSLKIAIQLSVGRLQGIHVPTEQREGYRSISRLREALIKHRHRVGCQLKSILFQQGLIRATDNTKVSPSWLKQLPKEKLSPDILYCVQYYSDLWLLLTNHIKDMNKKLQQQASQDSAIEIIYRSAPGIGVTAARVLANELGDMKQFANEKKLFSFTGLTPCEYSSGEYKRQGHISRQGRPILRKILVQSAWIAIRYDQSLKLIFERISKKAGKKRAIVGVARRLAGRIRACFITGELYCIVAT